MRNCPFCGGKPTEPFYYDPFDGYQGNLGRYRILCSNCKVMIEGDTKIKALAKWQGRDQVTIDEAFKAEVQKRLEDLKNMKNLVFVIRCYQCAKQEECYFATCQGRNGFCSLAERRNEE